jgi:aspartate kinase
MTIAVKFGGTSLADAEQFRKVAAIIKADANRRAVVVSAPGKRHKQDPKVTDILLSIHEMVERDMDATPPLALLRARYLEIERELGVDVGMAGRLDAFAKAALAGASLYENWTDVPGLLMTDPRVVPDAAPMERVTYRELRELAYSGANVFHEEAILPCKQVSMPIRIANTNDPAAPGTLIVPEAEAADRSIAGVAGRSGFCLLQIEKTLMNKERGFGRRVLGILETKGISYELSPSGIDAMCVVMEQKSFEGVEEEVLHEIRGACEPDSIEIERNLALISTVGHGMSRRVGVASRLFAALASAGVNVRIIDQGASELSIIVGVDAADLGKGLRAIYDAFVRA